MSSLNYVSIKWLLPLWKICNSDSGKTLKDITINYSNRTRLTKDICLPIYSHDPFKHLENTTIYVLLILTWKAYLMTHERFTRGMQKKYKSSHNLDKSTTVQILLKILLQIPDNPNRLKDANPIWIWIKLSTGESSKLYVKEIQRSCIC